MTKIPEEIREMLEELGIAEREREIIEAELEELKTIRYEIYGTIGELVTLSNFLENVVNRVLISSLLLEDKAMLRVLGASTEMKKKSTIINRRSNTIKLTKIKQKCETL